MQVRMLWGKRRESFPNEYAPELMVAWDEYCLDDNWGGYEAEKASAIAAWGADLVEAREMIVDIPEGAIRSLFRVPVVAVSARLGAGS